MFEHICKTEYPDMTSKEIIEVFREYDVNNNNKLDVNELVNIFEIFKIRNQNVYVFMRDLAETIKRMNINIYKISENFDNDKSKTIDFIEMKNLILSILPESTDLLINKVWCHLTEIHGGQITTSNMLQELLRYLPAEESQMKTRAHQALKELKNGLINNQTSFSNIFEYFDYNKDKKINLKQFAALFNSIVGYERHEEIAMVFNLIDQDKSGFICPMELK